MCLESAAYSSLTTTTCAANVVILVDKTGSVGVQNWAVSKQFVNDVISALPVGIDVKVGVISFSSDAKVEVALGSDESSDVDALKSAVWDMEYDGAGSLIRLGMKKTREEFDGATGKSIAVIITDGPSAVGGGKDQDAIEEANAAKEAGVEIIGIGEYCNVWLTKTGLVKRS